MPSKRCPTCGKVITMAKHPPNWCCWCPNTSLKDEPVLPENWWRNEPYIKFPADIGQITQQLKLF